LIESLGELVVAVAQAFDTGIGVTLLRHQRLVGDILVTDHRLALAHTFIQVAPAQRCQARLELALVSLVFTVLLSSLGLALQALELALQLLAQVGQACKVLLSAADPAFGFAAALLVFGDARRLFDEIAQLFWLGLDELGDHALLDDRIAARA
jgi:hypothetical protein